MRVLETFMRWQPRQAQNEAWPSRLELLERNSDPWLPLLKGQVGVAGRGYVLLKGEIET